MQNEHIDLPQLKKEVMDWIVMSRESGKKESSPVLYEVKTSIARLEEKMTAWQDANFTSHESILNLVKEIKDRQDSLEVKTEGFGMIKALVFGFSGLILTSVIIAIITMVIKK